MAYTLAAPSYGTSYQVQLQGAQDRFTEVKLGRLIQPSGRFQSRDRPCLFRCGRGEQGRLVLYNLTQQQNYSHPKHLVVVDFKPCGGEKAFLLNRANK